MVGSSACGTCHFIGIPFTCRPSTIPSFGPAQLDAITVASSIRPVAVITDWYNLITPDLSSCFCFTVSHSVS